MTVPRELSWKGGILCQKPVRELEALRKDEIVFEQGEAEIHGGAFDLVAERDIAGDIPVRICFNQEFQITYGHGVVSMEFLNNTGSGRTIRKAKLDGLQNVRILMDVSLMEVYFNDGELVMTTRYYLGRSDDNKRQHLRNGTGKKAGQCLGSRAIRERDCIVRLEESGISCYTRCVCHLPRGLACRHQRTSPLPGRKRRQRPPHRFVRQNSCLQAGADDGIPILSQRVEFMKGTSFSSSYLLRAARPFLCLALS